MRDRYDRTDRDEQDDRDEPEPKSRRRPPVDDEDDDQPVSKSRRRRHADDEDDERDEPDSRRRRRPRYDDNSRDNLDSEDLRAIATYQKTLLICILLQIGLGVAYALVDEKLRLFIGIGTVIVGVVGAVFIFQLAMRVYSTTGGVILGILTLVPLVGLIVLLIVNQKATAILTSNGIKVGLLGARSSDIEALNRRGRRRRKMRFEDEDDDEEDDRPRRR